MKALTVLDQLFKDPTKLPVMRLSIWLGIWPKKKHHFCRMPPPKMPRPRGEVGYLYERYKEVNYKPDLMFNSVRFYIKSDLAKFKLGRQSVDLLVLGKDIFLQGYYQNPMQKEVYQYWVGGVTPLSRNFRLTHFPHGTPNWIFLEVFFRGTENILPLFYVWNFQPSDLAKMLVVGPSFEKNHPVDPNRPKRIREDLLDGLPKWELNLIDTRTDWYCPLVRRGVKFTFFDALNPLTPVSTLLTVARQSDEFLNSTVEDVNKVTQSFIKRMTITPNLQYKGKRVYGKPFSEWASFQ